MILPSFLFCFVCFPSQGCGKRRRIFFWGCQYTGQCGVLFGEWGWVISSKVQELDIWYHGLGGGLFSYFSKFKKTPKCFFRFLFFCVMLKLLTFCCTNHFVKICYFWRRNVCCPPCIHGLVDGGWSLIICA